MQPKRTTKIIASTLIIASVMAINPVRVNAEWKQDNTEWWYSERNEINLL